MKIKVGYAMDWCGQATHKIRIIDETISGKYVCQPMFIVMHHPDGSEYLAEPITGFSLRDKSEFKDIHEEEV